MTIVTDSLAIDQLTESELIDRLRVGAIDAETFGAEVERREATERRRAAARAGARARNAEWETAAYAQYQRVLAAGWSSGLLSEAGKRKGREPWPLLWHGNEQDARLLASDEVLRYWDHVEPRIPPPAEYRAAQRAAAAEHQAWAEDATPAPSAPRAPVPTVRPPAPVPVVAYCSPHAERIAALARRARELAAGRHNTTARVLSRVNGGIQQ